MRLLERAIDYAGLFPPAQLSLAEGVRNYSGYLRSPQAWALGRFLLPASQMGDFEAAGGDRAWRLGVVGRPAAAVSPPVEAVEAPVGDGAAVAGLTAAVPGAICYCEVDLDADWLPLLEDIQRAGARAKIRTGGAKTPSAEMVTSFLAACAIRKLRFKATAGLHQPLRHGTTHGYLNIAATLVLLMRGATEAEAIRAMQADSFKALSVESFDTARDLWDGFGSCSFDEPLQGWAALGL